MSEGVPHEIVIIKRVSGGHEDEHHGGVWKIAFADFMTAMMAFFLVMWLISANDKTKAVIARYFNPVQLVDSTPQPKGLEDPKPGSPSILPKAGGSSELKPHAEKVEEKPEKVNEAKAPSENKAKAAAEQASKHEESTLLNDPYAVLSEIAGRPDEQPVRDKQKLPSAGDKGGSGAVGIKGGEAYRDPFEPLPLPPGASAADAFSDAVHTAEQRGEVAATRPQQPAPQPDASASAAKPETENRGSSLAEAGPVTTDPQSAALSAKLEGAMAGKGAPAGTLPKLDVRHTAEGTLIDLTDGPAFAMFQSASAEPSPRMVRLMAKIGRVLKDGKGQITIRGFTDGRPFRSDVYDNWRLSAARAHMAHYMLVRGGVDEQRFERIEGLADRQPKNPKDPYGPENRRIEILVRDAP